MTNAALARHFRELATVMEYRGDNVFKYRSYARAADTIKKAPHELAAFTKAELTALPSIGDAIADKILELVASGKLDLLDRYRAEIPEVALELLTVKGLGANKVRQLVTELELESLGDLLHAIEENRVVQIKGFSHASQAKLREQLEFYVRSQGQLRLPDILSATAALVAECRDVGLEAQPAGAAARHCPTAGAVAVWLAVDTHRPQPLLDLGFVPAAAPAWYTSDDAALACLQRERGGVQEHVCTAPIAHTAWLSVVTCASPQFLRQHPPLLTPSAEGTAEAVFAKAGLPFTPAPQREPASPWPPVAGEDLVQVAHLRGVVHAHTTWSDGSAGLPELATACREAGYEYLAVTDHSRAAGYANGLSVDRLRAQALEVAKWNAAHPDFRVFHGTECDILRDGRLDYDDEVLAELDLVIASVHSVLRMSRADATERILRAIANPYVTMLGHPTGRLLLSRAGYDLDVDAVLAACAEHRVAVEINANPMRLDLEWRHVGLAVELGVKISINPDAHSPRGIDDIRYGVLVAQKAGLRPRDCVNCLDAGGFAEYLLSQRRERLDVPDAREQRPTTASRLFT